METDQKCTFLSLIPDSLTEKAWLWPEDCAVGSLNDSHARQFENKHSSRDSTAQNDFKQSRSKLISLTYRISMSMFVEERFHGLKNVFC